MVLYHNSNWSMRRNSFKNVCTCVRLVGILFLARSLRILVRVVLCRIERIVLFSRYNTSMFFGGFFIVVFLSLFDPFLI